MSMEQIEKRLKILFKQTDISSEMSDLLMSYEKWFILEDEGKIREYHRKVEPLQAEYDDLQRQYEELL